MWRTPESPREFWLSRRKAAFDLLRSLSQLRVKAANLSATLNLFELILANFLAFSPNRRFNTQVAPL